MPCSGIIFFELLNKKVFADFSRPNERLPINVKFVRSIGKQAKKNSDFTLFGFCVKMLNGRVPFDIKLVAGNMYRKKPIVMDDPIHKLVNFLEGPSSIKLIAPTTAKREEMQ